MAEEWRVESGEWRVSRQYTYGLALISQRTLNSQLSTLNFFGMDGHNNVRYLTDASGAKTDTYDYDAFGVLIASTGNTPNNYLYCGEQWDADLGMYFLRARYLNPGTGRFWTMDDFEGDFDDPISLHKYLYTGNDPINKVDPSGNLLDTGTLLFTSKEHLKIQTASGRQAIAVKNALPNVAAAAGAAALPLAFYLGIRLGTVAFAKFLEELTRRKWAIRTLYRWAKDTNPGEFSLRERDLDDGLSVFQFQTIDVIKEGKNAGSQHFNVPFCAIVPEDPELARVIPGFLVVPSDSFVMVLRTLSLPHHYSLYYSYFLDPAYKVKFSLYAKLLRLYGLGRGLNPPHLKHFVCPGSEPDANPMLPR